MAPKLKDDLMLLAVCLLLTAIFLLPIYQVWAISRDDLYRTDAVIFDR